MVTENTPYRNKKYIVEDLEFDPKFKNEKEIEDLNFKRDNAYGVWDAKGRNEDERINDLFNKVQDYMGIYLTSLSCCSNRPHALPAFKSPEVRGGRSRRIPPDIAADE